MTELRLAGAVLAAFFAALMGYTLRGDLKRRMELLQELYRGLLTIHQEMDYRKTPMEEALQHAGDGLMEPLSSFFRETGIRLEKLPGASFFDVWKEMADWYLSGSGLRAEDLRLIRQLGEQLGKMEPGGGSSLLTVYEQRLLALGEAARTEYQEKGMLYQRLGILGGAFLVILLL